MRAFQITMIGGARRDRTDDLLNANQALSQLSYGPLACGGADPTPGKARKADRPPASEAKDSGGPGTTRTSDLTLIRGAL